MRRPNPYDRLVSLPWEPVEVRCRSEHRYAQEPRALHWDDRWLAVRQVAARWHAPEGPAFRLLAEDGGLYEVRYLEAEERWVGRRL